MSFKVTVQPSNHAFTVEDGQSVLDAALAAGIVLPYSCRNGACSTCKGKVLEGSFDAGDSPAHVLAPEELEQGYTLFCQAKPTSDMVIEAREIRMASDIQIRKMPARVMAIEDAASDVKIIKLQLPAADPFRYYAGQYLEFILKDGRRRSYSMATIPNENNLVELHIRHTPGGVFTDHVFGAGATQMKPREILRVEGPLGSFFLREESGKPIVFLASGTGFAPIKAIIERMMETGSTRKAVLYWGGRRPADLYMDALAREWETTLPDFTYVPVVSDALPEDGWTGRGGYVHQAVMQDLPDLSGHQVYACGAPVVVESARRDFVKLCGLPEEEFYADAFTTEADIA
ncbi:CDP-6-deoxy-delta-3,4-glucoseen reductase [Parapusillimonas granuli]|uniref:CDP-6-deoxy-delta-3,4-glucoseen reductase n=1 Tax=Parapusillimonas granuli TaxID=380911 RepID=A0A853FZ54_9BURK|nr:CDP-6-deoxy-delta-3,4-glucoseen reductase [Parapusillimonas granuli]MBB5217048.1 CDP-4-dehydro-6-deoxyglucose reductase [Parapusillimonas granuli]MEB2400622.1 CDP-6-deoxy-delta-3,4-glucoseen reductase [Alcaligenaceae bacterium]NYT50188.1 CDP-6-deoxy-delta-3,4-glucoseen reductase [Parapusillimonas granuli]